MQAPADLWNQIEIDNLSAKINKFIFLSSQYDNEHPYKMEKQ